MTGIRKNRNLIVVFFILTLLVYTRLSYPITDFFASRFQKDNTVKYTPVKSIVNYTFTKISKQVPHLNIISKAFIGKTSANSTIEITSSLPEIFVGKYFDFPVNASILKLICILRI